MAEEELIRGHAKQALQELTDKKKGWKEKSKDFLWEIVIIIVAVNITLWFHSWSEKRHERELEKNFLIGTREDLNIVKKSLEDVIDANQSISNYYDSICTQMNEHRMDKAFVDENSASLSNYFLFFYDNSRFENFKSSGYLRLIENDSLSMSITALYTVILPRDVNFDNILSNERQSSFMTYIGSKAQYDSSGKMIVSNLLNIPDVKFQIQWQRGRLSVRKWQKQDTIKQIDAVIAQIDQELKTRFKYKEE